MGEEEGSRMTVQYRRNEGVEENKEGGRRQEAGEAGGIQSWQSEVHER